MGDNSPKPILAGGNPPKDGDMLKYDETLGGWVAASLDEELANATKIGIYTLPLTDGSAGDVLSTDGAGNLSWLTPA